MTEPVWPYDVPGGDFHDLRRCKCDRHCRNCGRVLEGRERFYCSSYCGRVWRAEIALDALFREALQ